AVFPLAMPRAKETNTGLSSLHDFHEPCDAHRTMSRRPGAFVRLRSRLETLRLRALIGLFQRAKSRDGYAVYQGIVADSGPHPVGAGQRLFSVDRIGRALRSHFAVGHEVQAVAKPGRQIEIVQD